MGKDKKGTINWLQRSSNQPIATATGKNKKSEQSTGSKKLSIN